MKRQMRSRRSASSCSQSSISLANVEAGDAQPKQKKIDFNEIQRQYLQLYADIKGYTVIDNNKLQKNIVFKWKESLKQIIQQCRDYFKSANQSILMLKSTINQIEQSKASQIRIMQQTYKQELKVLENSSNKRIFDANAQFSKKQQQYKQVISKFVETLHRSQKNWSRIHAQLSAKVKKTQQHLKRRMEIDLRNQSIYQKILNITNQNQVYQDDSLASINLSNDEVVVQIPRMQSRRNTIDISSIDEIEQYEDCQGQNINRFEDCLGQLLKWGFFSYRNLENIKKIIQMTKSMENPEQIRKQPIFPILVEAIKLYLNIQRGEDSMVSGDEQREQQYREVGKENEMYKFK